jgi:hypothetical protein
LLETLTLGNAVQAEVLRPRIYINTFPKSGTHLANLICAHLAHIQEPRHWLGSFNGNSWKSEWVAKDYLLRVIRGQPEGTWYQGHMGYDPRVEKAFDEMNVCMFFVYRDLRDVAVSQTYHIEHPDDDKCRHPNKALYKEMASHEDRLLAVINGVSEFPGIIERWKLYASWLDVPWVLPVRYEDMRQRPEWVAEKAVNYVIERTTKAYDVRSVFFAETILNAINKAIDNLGTTKYSASYRKGNVGDWQTEFTPKIKKAFKKADQDNWLERLGYTDETEW